MAHLKSSNRSEQRTEVPSSIKFITNKDELQISETTNLKTNIDLLMNDPPIVVLPHEERGQGDFGVLADQPNKTDLSLEQSDPGVLLEKVNTTPLGNPSMVESYQPSKVYNWFLLQ